MLIETHGTLEVNPWYFGGSLVPQTTLGGLGGMPDYKYMYVCSKRVSYQSSRVLAILWVSRVLSGDGALDDEVHYII